MPDMNKPERIEGRVWVLTGPDGRLLNDIDTDQIFHNRHLSVTDPEATGRFAFGNLPGWEDFPDRAEAGDLILAGSNFGCGSSRQQAVDCFLALKTGAVLARSFAPIYYRNAVNAALPVIVVPELDSQVAEHGIENGTVLRVNFVSGEVRGPESRRVLFRAEPFSGIQMEIYRAGGLLRYGLNMIV